jgi:transcriptional regulator with XRE-family HTH domain
MTELPLSKSTARSFGNRLRNIREMSGLTQSELGQKADINPTAIAHMEAGRRDPNLENLTKIVRALGLSADVLLGTARP